MKIIKIVVYWLLICCVPLVIITSNIRCGVNEIRVYEYGINTYPISRVTGIEKPELVAVYQHLIDYYNLKEVSPQIKVNKGGKAMTLFSDKELVHLADVKNLIRLDYLIQLIVLVVLLGSVLFFLLSQRYDWYRIVRGLWWGSIVTIGVMIVLGAWSFFGFDQLFVLFHMVSFPNEFWMLDPGRDYLIMLFPGGFFYDVALFGFGAVFMEAILLGIIAYLILRLRKKETNVV